MHLRQARTFVTVAELGTVSKAALRLRIAQPALSRQIIDLEQELGLRLLTASDGGVAGYSFPDVAAFRRGLEETGSDRLG
jgi:DNA-binding transcriptional LysR family regulator